MKPGKNPSFRSKGLVQSVWPHFPCLTSEGLLASGSFQTLFPADSSGFKFPSICPSSPHAFGTSLLISSAVLIYGCQPSSQFKIPFQQTCAPHTSPLCPTCFFHLVTELRFLSGDPPQLPGQAPWKGEMGMAFTVPMAVASLGQTPRAFLHSCFASLPTFSR